MFDFSVAAAPFFTPQKKQKNPGPIRRMTALQSGIRVGVRAENRRAQAA
jgi:hypothetical protein